MTRPRFGSFAGLLAATALSVAAVPAQAGYCCHQPPSFPQVIYAPPPVYAPPIVEAPVIATYPVDLGPSVTGLDVDSLAYPQPVFYPAQPARVFPYVSDVHGPAYGARPYYRTYPHRRHWTKRKSIWK